MNKSIRLRIILFIISLSLLLSSCLSSNIQKNSSETPTEEESSLFEESSPETLSEDGDSFYIKAIEALKNGENELVLKYTEKAIELKTTDYDMDNVYKLRGSAFDALDMYPEAIEAYKKGLEINDQNFTIWTNLGVAYRLSGDHDKAVESYEKALSINPDYPEAYSSIGTIKVLTGESAEAIKYFEKAIEIDPTIGVSYGNMALALAMEGRFEEADEALEKSIVNGYENADAIKERIEALK